MMQRGVVGVVTVSVLLFLSTVSWAEGGAAACSAAKVRATGGRMGRALGCYAKATRKGRTVDASCLAATVARLSRAFEIAERRGGCLTSGDLSVVGGSVESFVAGMVAALTPGSPEAAARRCAATKMAATGAKAARDLRCWATAVRASTPVDGACLAKASTVFARTFEKAEAKGGCPTTGDATNLDAGVVTFVAAVVSALTPDGPSTTTSSTTTTTLSGETTTTTGLSGTTTTTTLAPGSVSFARDVQPLFTANCAFSGCHAGPSPAQGLDLSAGHAYGDLVNVASGECALFKRVFPGQPTTSYLVFKIAGPPQPCFSGAQMPSGGRPPLAVAEQDTIANWILQGAVNN